MEAISLRVCRGFSVERLSVHYHRLDQPLQRLSRATPAFPSGWEAPMLSYTSRSAGVPMFRQAVATAGLKVSQLRQSRIL
jgi:hypothetical protein